MSDESANLFIYYFSSNEIPIEPIEWRCYNVSLSLSIEDLARLCAEEFNISTHSFPFFGLRLEINGGGYWLPPNHSLRSGIGAINRGRLFFRFRFKPARSLCRNLHQRKIGPKHFGFRALLQQSIVLQDQLWSLLLGQCEYDLEKETQRLLAAKDEIRGDLWALLLLGRSDANLKKQKWKKEDDIAAQSPKSLAKNKRFVRDVASCIEDATKKFGGLARHDVWLTFLVEYAYENNSRLIDTYHAVDESNNEGVIFIDTQDSTCYPIIKFHILGSEMAQEVCTLRDLISYSIFDNTLKLLLKKQGQSASFKFRIIPQLLSFASEIDAQYRTSIDWYANLCSDDIQQVFSPRANMLKSNRVLPPSGLSANLPGIRVTDDVPSSILSIQPFILQQSSQKVGWLKVTFSKHVLDQSDIRWQLRFIWDNHGSAWSIKDLSGGMDLEETNLSGSFPSLEAACQALLNEIIERDVPVECRTWNWDASYRDGKSIMARLAHIGCLPRIHFIDSELVEDAKLDGHFQGLPVLAISSQVIKLAHVADGDYSRLCFAAWQGMQFLLREYNGQRNHFLSCFWQAAESSAQWLHPGLASVVAFSPASDCYLLDFASSPLDAYLLHLCSSAVYLTHLLQATEMICQALGYLAVHQFYHGDVRLANVVLLSHTVEQPNLKVKLLPPEICVSVNAQSYNEDLRHKIVFMPPRGVVRSDIYSFGVTIIQLLRLGHVPPPNDIESLLQDPPTLSYFMDRFPTSGEYVPSVSKLFNIIRRCLTYRDDSFNPSFLSRCCSELNELLTDVRKLWPTPLNAGCSDGGFESEVNKFFHIHHREILPCENSQFKRLSRGHFGEVLQGFWLPSTPGAQQKPVALKRLLHDQPDDSQITLSRLSQEFDIWSQLRHSHIVQVFGLTWFEERPCIVMEYVDGGLTLERHCRGKQRGMSFFKEMLHLLLQVVDGMRYLSERNRPILHCDLAARNVLISPQGSSGLTAKIADFGLACILDPASIYHRLSVAHGPMPMAWSAPEVFNDCRATPASDVWSFGVLAWEVLCQKDPRDQNRRRHATVDGYLPFTQDIPATITKTISRCWRQHPDERPSFKDLEILLKEVYRNEFEGDA